MNRCRLVSLILLVLFSPKVFAQFGINGIESAYTDFTLLLNAFLQAPTNRTSNEDIFRRLDYLQEDIKQANVSQEERGRFEALASDIEIVKEFMAPISNKYNSHLKESQLIRLQGLFG